MGLEVGDEVAAVAAGVRDRATVEPTAPGAALHEAPRTCRAAEAVAGRAGRALAPSAVSVSVGVSAAGGDEVAAAAARLDADVRAFAVCGRAGPAVVPGGCVRRRSCSWAFSCSWALYCAAICSVRSLPAPRAESEPGSCGISEPCFEGAPEIAWP